MRNIAQNLCSSKGGGENMIGYYLLGAVAGLVLIVGAEIVLTAIEDG